MKHGNSMLIRLALLIYLSLVGVVVVGSAPTSRHLRFYMHDLLVAYPGSPATAVHVARGATPLPTAPNLRFGDIYVVDDLLTEGPDAASRALGRAQGLYVIASQTEVAPLLCVNVVLTAGPFNGSSVAVLGSDLIKHKVDVRELPVVGGTGTLRGVSGYWEFRTHTLNATDGNAVFQIDMYLSLTV